MRGHSENINMSLDLINTLLDQTCYIDALTFSGGEPTLNIELINQTLNLLKQKNILLGSFYIITNGVEQSIDLIHTMIQYYQYSENKDECGFRISGDSFHHIEPPDISLYSALSFFRKDQSFYEYDPKSIIDEGYAMENGLGKQGIIVDDQSAIFSNNILTITGLTYVGATGNILTTCDASYVNEPEYALGNILDESIYEIYKPCL